MIDLAPGPDESLAELLAHRARHASDLRLALDAAGGVVATIAALTWRPFGWPLLVCASVGIAAYGAWGIADRELGERAPGDHDAGTLALRAARTAAAALGALAAAALVFLLLGLALGTWIS